MSFSKAPRQEQLSDLFVQHLSEHKALPDSARVRDLGAEKALIQDYSGRVVYELLQNALDRADSRILVRWDPELSCLEVANDGSPVSAYPGQDPARSDFHALLSLHSSPKAASDSIGNKGVGFRSVFSVTADVEVWSRTTQRSWWGMILTHPATSTPTAATQWSSYEVASFYAPQIVLSAPYELMVRFDDYQTVVRLKGVRPERADTVGGSIRELMRLPLRFLEQRARNPRELTITLETHKLGESPVRVERRIIGDKREIAVAGASLPVTDPVRRDTGLKLDQAHIRVLAYAVESDGIPDRNDVGLYWSYLPTEQGSGFGVHVHADFYLSNSRRNLALRDLTAADELCAADPAGWNRRLLREAAKLIVRDLWHRLEVCQRVDFWALANPEHCQCRDLAAEVGGLLFLGNGDEFAQLVFRTFLTGAGPWPLQRYVDFFVALEAWATYAYHHAGGLVWTRTWNARYQWQRWLLELVEKSGAPILPIVDRSGDDVWGQSVAVARPLVIGKTGAHRRDGDRIYRRSPTLGTTQLIGLPAVVQAQGTYVTAFNPPGANTNELGLHGLLEFSRPEILAQLREGGSETEHRELLLAAVRIAAEEPTMGRGESILMRAIELRSGPAWRLVVDQETPLGRAARNLRNLCVPTLAHGWQPARTVARTGGGPWPRLDEQALEAMFPGANLNAKDSQSVDEVCILIGIGVLPINDTGAIPDFPLQPSSDLGRSILQAWGRDLFPLFQPPCAPSVFKAREQLQGSPWLHADLFDDEVSLGGKIERGVGPGAPYRPLDIWWQTAQRGFRTRLLPRLIIDREDVLPAWANDLRLENPLRAASEPRIKQAMDRLRGAPDAMQDERDLVELYRNLVDGALRIDPPLRVPLLYRHVDNEGRIGNLAWGEGDVEVWHDPGEPVSSALSVFRDVNVWVYRGGTKVQANALGAVHFDPPSPKVNFNSGNQRPELAETLRQAIWRALPDLFAAAALAREHFDHGEAIHRQAVLAVEHYEGVWIEWEFRNKSATRGFDEEGDVFLLPKGGAQRALCFDGNQVPLPECAFPLSELLCDSRAFGALFLNGLYAWANAGNGEQAPPSVIRFRRDHNLGEADIINWRNLLQAARLNPEQVREWRVKVDKVLSRYGQPSGTWEPGMIVTPNTWSHVTGDVGEEALQTELSAELANGQETAALVPKVAFRDIHRQRFLKQWENSQIDYIAAAAELRDSRHWNESLLENLETIGIEKTPISTAEECLFARLQFDPDRAWRARFKLSLDDPLDPGYLAKQFAAGKIPLDHLPTKALDVALRPFTGEPAKTLHASIDGDEWLRRERRKAVGGDRAEKAVLALAVSTAMAWREQDRVSFDRAVDAIKQGLGNEGLKRAADLSTSEAMAEFLYIASYIGNAGFDVLVPEQSESQFLLVEIKRVTHVAGEAVFFLSENERRRAMGYKEKQLQWRLWLVASNNVVTDATGALAKFQSRRAEVAALLADGLQPGEWMLAATIVG